MYTENLNSWARKLTIPMALWNFEKLYKFLELANKSSRKRYLPADDGATNDRLLQLIVGAEFTHELKLVL